MANVIRIKRRAIGAPGAPSSLANAELAYNEVNHTLYYGEGTGGSGGSATTVVPIGGAGAFLPLGGGTLAGPLTLSADPVWPRWTRRQQRGRRMSMSGASSPNVASIAALRLFASTGAVVFVQGYTTPGDGGEGMFWQNAADTTSADDAGTIIVASNGVRWYRLGKQSALQLLWFGGAGVLQTSAFCF